MTLSEGPGTIPVLQFADVLQVPPSGFVHETAAENAVVLRETRQTIDNEQKYRTEDRRIYLLAELSFMRRRVNTGN